MKNYQVFILLIAFTFSACSTLKNKTILISPGDSKEKVISILGAPDDRQFREEQEAWQYGTVVAMGVCEYTVVWYNKSVVSGLNTYRNNSVAGCRVGLQAIKWENAPSAIIEVRNR